MYESKVTVVDVWYCYHTDDGGMGRETGPIGWSSSDQAAQTLRGNDPYADVRKLKALKVSGSEPTVYYPLANNGEPIDVDQVEQKRRAEIRKTAMAKLTPEEIAALGLR